MNHAEAEELAARYNREHPDRKTHTFLAREMENGGWDVVKVNIPGRGPTTATVESKPRPPQSDDAPLWQSTGGVPPGVAGP
jgi:hypothetical protein